MDASNLAAQSSLNPLTEVEKASIGCGVALFFSWLKAGYESIQRRLLKAKRDAIRKDLVDALDLQERFRANERVQNRGADQLQNDLSIQISRCVDELNAISRKLEQSREARRKFSSSWQQFALLYSPVGFKSWLAMTTFYLFGFFFLIDLLTLPFEYPTVVRQVNLFTRILAISQWGFLAFFARRWALSLRERQIGQGEFGLSIAFEKRLLILIVAWCLFLLVGYPFDAISLYRRQPLLKENLSSWLVVVALQGIIIAGFFVAFSTMLIRTWRTSNAIETRGAT